MALAQVPDTNNDLLTGLVASGATDRQIIEAIAVELIEQGDRQKRIEAQVAEVHGFVSALAPILAQLGPVAQQLGEQGPMGLVKMLAQSVRGQ